MIRLDSTQERFIVLYKTELRNMCITLGDVLKH